MGVAKVIMNNETFIDVTDATITSVNLKEDSVAYDFKGDKVIGSAQEHADDYITSAFLRTPRIENFEWNGPSGNLQLTRVSMVENITIHGSTTIPNNASINTGITGVISLPDVTKIGTSCWGSDSINCTCIYVPKVTSIGSNFFQNKSYANLIKMVIGTSPFTNTSSTGSFRGTKNLKALVLKVSSVPTLGGTSAISQSALITDPNSYVYVPKSLKSSFEEATNWSTLKFRAIEDYPLIDAPDTWVPTEENEE